MSVDPTTTETPASGTAAPEAGPTATVELEHVTEDLLVEDVSIDGMCGVY